MKRFFTNVVKFFFVLVLIVVMVGIAGSLGFGLYYYLKITHDLPKIEKISDYQPKAVTSVLSEEGKLIAEAWEERRYPITIEQVPIQVRNAFLAAEDANFYNHPGIDFISIARAIYVNFRSGRASQGASTITQQVVKSLLLTRAKRYERKAKEAILAYKIERALSKDDIFSIYLNEIYLGATTYGVKAAAQVYFHKSLVDLNVAESAFLGGLPQQPSLLSKPENRKQAISRQHYVLEQMLRNGMITRVEKEEAEDYKLQIYPPKTNKIFESPYFSSFALAELRIILERQGMSPDDPGGFVVHTTGSVELYKLAERSLRRGLKELDKRQGWRGPLARGMKDQLPEEILNIHAGNEQPVLKSHEVYPAKVIKVNRKKGLIGVQVGEFIGVVDLNKSKWARRFINDKGNVQTVRLRSFIKQGDIIEVSLDQGRVGDESLVDIRKPAALVLDQTPVVQGAFVLCNVYTGEVKTVIGGYNYSNSQFNRATQGLRQPGSAFKPFIYLGAVDYLNYTPATIVPDSPISMVAGNGELWTPQNYDRKFIGPITLRTALQRSRNVVSVFLLQQIGVDKGIEVARKFGISTKIGRNMSISLGTAEVKLIELVRAYGAFAASGWLADRTVITKIEDRFGNVVYHQRPKQKQVVSEDSAFIMANMMKGVVERGTARRVSALGRPVAGKTGTTNDQMDAWFIGYTPEWVAGAWVGFDMKRTLGRYETGGKAAAPIFLYFMQEFLKDEPELDFDIPDGVIPVYVHSVTGYLVDADHPKAFLEYFKSGTEPTTRSSDAQARQDYLSSDEF